ncbi:hypothetical protein Tco_0888464, partial [Tanacetum coccineum]
MPPKRTTRTVRTARVAAVYSNRCSVLTYCYTRRAPSVRTANNPARNASTTTDAPMSAAVINQLIETRVTKALTNQEQLRSSGVNSDSSQNSRSERPTGEIKKLEIELWNLKVKGTDIPSYTLRFQELALMCGRMFPEESDEFEKYVSGLPDMIRGNVMSYQPQTMEEVIEFANDQMDQKLITISKRKAEQKRKIKFNVRNNQGYQQ